MTKLKRFLCSVLYRNHKVKLGFYVDSNGELYFASRCERCGKKIIIKYKEDSK